MTKPTPAVWCCPQFEGTYEAAGGRAFSILVDFQPPDDPSFILQHRAVELDQELPAIPIPIAVVSEVHILFCPWCGRNLREFYGATAASLVRPGFRI